MEQQSAVKQAAAATTMEQQSAVKQAAATTAVEQQSAMEQAVTWDFCCHGSEVGMDTCAVSLEYKVAIANLDAIVDINSRWSASCVMLVSRLSALSC